MSLDNQTDKNEKTRADMAARLASLDDSAPQNESAAAPEGDPIDSIGAHDTFVSEAPAEFATISAPGVVAGANDGGSPAPEARRKRSKLWIIPVVIVALLAAGYLGGAFYFNDHCLPNTTVDGADVSLKSKAEVASSIESEVSGYAIAVTGDGVELSLSASDLSLGYDGDAYASDVMSRTSAWSWPVELTKTRTYQLQKTVSYDREKVVSALAPFVDESKSAAEATVKNASISYDGASKSFVLNNSGDTHFLNGDAAAEKICSALSSLKTSVELGDDCMSDGDDLSKSVVEANSYLAAAPTLTLTGTTVTEVSADQIASWLKIGDDLSVEIDSDAVTTWCTGDLSKACDTVGASRTYTRPDGKSVTVSGGTYGWNINGADTATQIVDALKSGQKTTIEIPTYSSAATYTPGGQDWGNRYIDVDLAEQHARMYDDSGNLIWESDIVTGDATKSYDTPCGVYTMNSNRASNNVELRGKIDASTGEPEYISYVDYWMPFIGNSYALHDASWRSRFGGTIYQGNGSHGCVNLPVDKAAEIFNLCSVGDIVVVHN